MERSRGDDRHAALSLGRELDIVPIARRFVLDRLRDWAVDPLVRNDAALVATELVTNALRHGPPPVVLNVALVADRVRISVADSSPASPRLGEPSAEDESGRGLALLDALASSWGSAPAADGKQVWCELPSNE